MKFGGLQAQWASSVLGQWWSVSRRGMLKEINPPVQAQLIQWEQSAGVCMRCNGTLHFFHSPIRKLRTKRIFHSRQEILQGCLSLDSALMRLAWTCIYWMRPRASLVRYFVQCALSNSEIFAMPSLFLKILAPNLALITMITKVRWAELSPQPCFWSL